MMAPFFAVAVVQEAVADAGAGRERRQVARPHAVQVAVDPGVDLAVEQVNELLLVLLGVRPGRPRARRQPLEVDADADQARHVADATHGPIASRLFG
jgi:hypothetical protein